MRRMVLAGASLMVLAGCGHSEQAVGANSPGSITTTAVGNVVATIPSPTPTPDDAAVSTGDNMAAGDAMSNDTSATNEM